jgi:predicted nuclease of predicted toxin-antitoxin system
VRILADENVSRLAVQSLRAAGHDVVAVKDVMPGATDREILAHAQNEDRILITLDKDFGDLAFQGRLPAQCGVVLFRLSVPDPAHLAERINTVFNSRSDWSGHFAVVDDDTIRLRSLAPPHQDRS